MKPLRIGLIGTGKHGSRYAQHLVADLPQARLVAGCCSGLIGFSVAVAEACYRSERSGQPERVYSEK